MLAAAAAVQHCATGLSSLAGAASGLISGLGRAWRQLLAFLLVLPLRLPILRWLLALPLRVPLLRWMLSPRAPCSHTPQRLLWTSQTKPLLNLVIVGDDGPAATALAFAFAGRRKPAHAAPRADFLFADAPAASCSIWVPHRELLAAGPAFFSLADACMLVYDPAAEQHPTAQLEHWAGMCCGGQSRPSIAAECTSWPLVVVGSCWHHPEPRLSMEENSGASGAPASAAEASPVFEPDSPLPHGRGSPLVSQQAAAVAEAAHWCAQQGAVAHCLVGGPEDEGGMQSAFAALLAVALRCHQRGTTCAASAPLAAGPAEAMERQSVRTGGVPQLGTAGSLPLLLESELGPALQKLTPRTEHAVHMPGQTAEQPMADNV